MISTETISSPSAWNAAIAALPYAHILQSWEWGEFKQATTGWRPTRMVFRRGSEVVAAAAAAARSIGPLKVIYVSKGPALAYEDAEICANVLDQLQAFARKQGAVWLKIDPDVPVGYGVPGEADERPNATGLALVDALKARGWRFSEDQVQFRNTIQIDLTQSEDALLAAMNQGTRRKIRLAERAGVTVRAATPDDLAGMYALYRETGERDGFLVRPAWYYEQAWRKFMDAGLAHGLIAEYEGQMIANVVLYHFARTCWYFYGASSNAHRERMPNALLQWEAMKWAKAQGYRTYDLWGAPDVFDERDPMWGVYNFKRGFRGTVVRHIGAWDYAPSPLLYLGYTKVWPRILQMMKRSAIRG